ncbi:MAG: hypothetical protein ACI8RZ_007861 [Myxococcota bacterium]|jgi:hypothetical protein
MTWFIVEHWRHGGWFEVDRAGHPAIAQAIEVQLRETHQGGWQFSWWPTRPRADVRVREVTAPDTWGERREAAPPTPQERRVVSWGGRAMVVAAIEPSALHLGQRGRVLLLPTSGRGPSRIESLSAFPELTVAAPIRRAA